MDGDENRRQDQDHRAWRGGSGVEGCLLKTLQDWVSMGTTACVCARLCGCVYECVFVKHLLCQKGIIFWVCVSRGFVLRVCCHAPLPQEALQA